jgi:D-glycero-alpha-D-manno-heptose-7-phosphate kinase
VYAHAQSPCRIGIAGGGTDLPAWTSTRTGRCLSLAIKAYTHAVAISRPDGRVVASYRKRDEATAATEIANGLIRESALLHGWEDGFEVHTLSELSSHGSGLGVSSSIAVSLAACFQRLAALREPFDSRRMTGPTAEPRWQDGGVEGFRERVAKDAWVVEIDRLRRPIGRQDHMAAAHGGMRLYAFTGNDAAVERSFSIDDARWVAEHLCLVRLLDGHDSRAILSSVKNAAALESAAEAVPVAVRAIEMHDPEMLGAALSLGHLSKKGIQGAVPDALAEIVERINGVEGVHGCKVAGAGGGGHVVVAGIPEVLKTLGMAIRLPVVTVQADHDGVRSDGWT